MTDFARDIAIGLTSDPKYINSRYFYDETGCRLFSRIMDLPEYYLTRTEYEIIDANKEKLLQVIADAGDSFNLIDLGAGDALKTKLLIRYFINSGADFRYVPVDISQDTIITLSDNLKKEFPGLHVEGITDDYFSALESIGRTQQTRNVVLFLGSNIGNLNESETLVFLKGLFNNLNEGDIAFIGFDLRKNPRTILKAYNDSLGITREFNLNLLDRINRELGGNINREKFEHYPYYDPVSGEARSYLISLAGQTVYLNEINQTIHFYDSEPVFTEVSRKFTIHQIEELATRSGFTMKDHYLDENKMFADAVWIV